MSVATSPPTAYPWPTVVPGLRRSWWLADALAQEGDPGPLPALRGEVTADVAIVGGGFAGLWTALELARRAPTARIVLLERDICGSGASGKTGGITHGYWTVFGRIADAFGDTVATEVARAGSRAQEGLARFVRQHADEVWWVANGLMKVATLPAHERKIAHAVETIHRLGFGEQARPLSASEVADRCRSPRFRSGAWYSEAGTVQPARLARLLRREALAAKVAIYEQSAVTRVERGRPITLHTPGGTVRATDVVLATGAELSRHPALKARLTNFSSYAVMTDPAPQMLDAIRWTQGEAISDARMFLHYFRTTQDDRVLMGSGSGPIAFNGHTAGKMQLDTPTVGRAEAGLRRLLPGLATVAVADAWGAAIDVSADHLPFFGTLRGSRIHYAAGFSGHGVNPTYLAGQTLASLVLEQKDEWSESVFVRRAAVGYPPEPIRFFGGCVVRSAILACEEAEESGRTPSPVARAGAAIPRALHMKVGTR